MILDVMKPCNE